jgi:hypothetical protein
MAVNVDSEKDVETGTGRVTQQKIARQIFVVGIRLDHLIAVGRQQNLSE